MKKIYFLWSLMGLLMLQVGWAQQKTITGTILDETGLPLPGATVVIEETSRGVASDFDGNFSIDVTNGEVLIITYVGYANQQIVVGDEVNYNISLQADNSLSEVVVTAYGIKKEKRSVGYAVQEVKSREIVNSRIR